ncbi:uncharacterized protein LOC120651093 [Panicum virgatum]|nr:uncharacterized protein LOC120651093 [Panicum virgatum]XP_039784394.1 uncharacterized protein LOC120651093 [Panicum virgatum]
MLPSPSLGAATGDAKVADSSMETPWVDSKDRSCHNPSAQQAEKSSLSERSRSERSMAFKSWARCRCYRCLALDHQVSSCRDSFRCIRCRRPGHRERHCHFRSPSPAPRTRSSFAQPQRTQQTRSWADVVAASPQRAPHIQLAASPRPIIQRDAGRPMSMCGCKCHASLGLVATDLQSMLTPLMDSLRSELQQMILTTLDEVVRPLKEEASVIKLWLARVANHLEHIEIPSKESTAGDVVGLFGPCSPVQRSPNPSILASLAAACTPSSPLVCESACVDAADSIAVAEEITTKNFPVEIHPKTLMEETLSPAASVAGISTPTADDTSPSHTMEVPIKILTDATHLDPPMEHMMLQVDTPVEDVVLVEDASSDDDDDDADSYVSVVIEDPLLSVAVTDGSTLSTIEIKEEEPQPPDTSWLEATSPVATNDLKADDVRRPSVHHSPSMITTARCVRKSFDRSPVLPNLRCSKT